MRKFIVGLFSTFLVSFNANAIVSEDIYYPWEGDINYIKAMYPCVESAYYGYVEYNYLLFINHEKYSNGSEDEISSDEYPDYKEMTNLFDKCYQDMKKQKEILEKEEAFLQIGLSVPFYKYLQKSIYKADHPEAFSNVPVYNASQIVNAFKANELKANNDFKGKEIIVKGYVDRISVNFGKVCVEIRGDEYGIQNVGAYIIKSEENKAANLSAGQEIQVKGTCNGLSFLNVSLIDAVIL